MFLYWCCWSCAISFHTKISHVHKRIGTLKTTQCLMDSDCYAGLVLTYIYILYIILYIYINNKPLNTAGHIYNWFNGYEWEIALRQWLPHRQLPLNLAKLPPPSQRGRWPHLVGVLGLGHRVRVWISHSRVMVLNQLLGCCVYQRMLSTFVSDGSYSPIAKGSSRCQRVSERCIQTKGVAARINSSDIPELRVRSGQGFWVQDLLWFLGEITDTYVFTIKSMMYHCWLVDLVKHTSSSIGFPTLVPFTGDIRPGMWSSCRGFGIQWTSDWGRICERRDHAERMGMDPALWLSIHTTVSQPILCWVFVAGISQTKDLTTIFKTLHCKGWDRKGWKLVGCFKKSNH